jgi:HD-GYP domain-containing protein (c-di-GMP phosphodiesterase class II)
MEPILAFRTLAYFPAKVLEIIDVYDSLTDSRAYRASMSSEEALDLMFREFIIQHRKIDPILFDIFTAFIRDKELAASKK